MKSHCSKCNGIILADTEDWPEPLCYMHWHQFMMNKSYSKITNLISDVTSIRKDLYSLLSYIKDMKVD